MNKLKLKLVHIVINYLTRKLLKALTVDDVLIMSSRGYFIGELKLKREDLIALKQEAEHFYKSFLYQLIVKELKYKMTLQRYDQAETPTDMLFGKSMAYCIHLVEEFIKNIRAL